MSKKNELIDKGDFKLNRRNRRRLSASNRKRKKTNSNRIEDTTKIVYKDDSYIDKSKKVFVKTVAEAKERIERMKATIQLPKFLKMERRNLLTKIVVKNIDGKERELFPDKKPQHKILCRGNIAKVMVSGVCMLVRITQSMDEETGEHIDGSWAIVPATVDMMKATSIQHLKKRPLWFLKKYWYEISFDGRVQPAHMLFDYGIDPTKKEQEFWVTREYTPVRKTDEENDYFRFWKDKPSKNGTGNTL